MAMTRNGPAAAAAPRGFQQETAQPFLLSTTQQELSCNSFVPLARRTHQRKKKGQKSCADTMTNSDTMTSSSSSALDSKEGDLQDKKGEGTLGESKGALNLTVLIGGGDTPESKDSCPTSPGVNEGTAREQEPRKKGFRKKKNTWEPVGVGFDPLPVGMQETEDCPKQQDEGGSNDYKVEKSNPGLSPTAATSYRRSRASPATCPAFA